MDRWDFCIRMIQLPSGWRGMCIEAITTCLSTLFGTSSEFKLAMCIGVIFTCFLTLFGTGSEFKLGWNANWTCQIHSGLFGLRSSHKPEHELVFNSVFGILQTNLTEPNFGNNPCFLSISTSWTHIIWLSAIWSSSFLPLQWPILSHEWWGIHSQYALDVFYLLKFSVLLSDTYCSPSPTQTCFVTHDQLSSHFSKSCCSSTCVLDTPIFHAPAVQNSISHYAVIGFAHGTPWVHSILYPS